MSDAYDQVEVTLAPELRRWLKGHHNSSPGIWLVTYKKGAGEKYLAFEDRLRGALLRLDRQQRPHPGHAALPAAAHPAEAEQQLAAAEQGTGREA